MEYDNDLKEWGIEKTNSPASNTYPFTLYHCPKWDGFMVLAKVSISSSCINSYVGRMLFNAKEKLICFGLRRNNHGMVATTITDRGEFWNGELFVIVSLPIDNNF